MKRSLFLFLLLSCVSLPGLFARIKGGRKMRQ